LNDYDENMQAKTAPVRRSDEIYGLILRDIERGILAPGTKLPSETELARQHSVSRPTLREALARLREDGLIKSRQGSGAYVQVGIEKVQRIQPLASIGDLRDCFTYRVGIECAAIRLAAQHRTDGDLDTIRRAFASMDDRNAEGSTGMEEDFAFHRAVARASGNRFFVAALEQVRSHIEQGMTINRTLSLESTGTRLKLVQDEHARIIDALNRGAPDEAATAMERHLKGAQARLFEG
jgi:DNA-binding FadR family transcriptional regulator